MLKWIMISASSFWKNVNRHFILNRSYANLFVSEYNSLQSFKN